MINQILLECVQDNYILSNETLINFYFVRKLDKNRVSYKYLLVLQLLHNETGACYEREVILGSSRCI